MARFSQAPANSQRRSAVRGAIWRAAAISGMVILMQPDGLRAYVAVGSQNGVTIISLKTMEAAGHIETGPGPDGLAWAIKD